MNTFSFPQAQSIVVCGDIHGDFNQLIHKCCVLYEMTDTLIVVAGDCGFGFERREYYENIYKRNQQRLSKSNCWLVMLRGNHDNPAYFNEFPISHLRFTTIPDYSVLQACDHTILCVGGATSVDRSLRKSSVHYVPNQSDILAPNIYWNNEAPHFDEDQLMAISNSYAIDTVITHTAPSFCELVSKSGLFSWAAEDKRLMQDIENERRTMDSILSFLVKRKHPLRSWYYGHFHQSWHCEIDNVMYHMLDIMEMHEIH